MQSYTLFVLATLVSLLLSFPLHKLARSAGLVDRPDMRKSHEGEVPLIGGIIIFITIFAFTFAQTSNYIAPYFLALTLGVLDDRLHLKPYLRVIGQVIIASLVASQIQIYSLGSLFGSELMLNGYASYLFTIFAIVGLMNAMNLIDGLDGLCVSIFFVTLIILYAALNYHPAGFYIITGATLGFLLQNFRFYIKKKARIFLGDGGAYLLGLFLAVRLIEFSQGYILEGNIFNISPVLVLFIITVPLNETLGVMIKRTFFDRKSLSTAGRDHMHYFIADAVNNKVLTVFIIMGTAIFWAATGIGLLMLGATHSILLAVYVMSLVMHTSVLILASKYKSSHTAV